MLTRSLPIESKVCIPIIKAENCSLEGAVPELILNFDAEPQIARPPAGKLVHDVNERTQTPQLLHKINSLPGSSGSPILDSDNRGVALHTGLAENL